jgi:hypothetical protein
MKTARDLLAQLVEHTKPPRECPIKLKEWPLGGLTDRNWIAICGELEDDKRLLYAEEVVRMRKSNARVDWSDIKSNEDSRRIVQWPLDFEVR